MFLVCDLLDNFSVLKYCIKVAKQVDFNVFFHHKRKSETMDISVIVAGQEAIWVFSWLCNIPLPKPLSASGISKIRIQYFYTLLEKIWNYSFICRWSYLHINFLPLHSKSWIYFLRGSWSRTLTPTYYTPFRS